MLPTYKRGTFTCLMHLWLISSGRCIRRQYIHTFEKYANLWLLHDWCAHGWYLLIHKI